MIDFQVPALYVFGVIGSICGVFALLLSILTYKNTKQTKRIQKSLIQGIELLLAGQDKEVAETSETKAYLIKTLRELEHDHDKFKDVLDGYSQTLQRIEGVARQIKENQNQHILKNNNASSANNKVKINTEKPAEAYEAKLVNALLRQLVDKMHNLSDNIPPPKD